MRVGLLVLCLLLMALASCGYSGPNDDGAWREVLYDPVNGIVVEASCAWDRTVKGVIYEDCRLVVKPYVEGQG